MSTHLYGREINAETYAICKADLLLKGEGDTAENVRMTARLGAQMEFVTSARSNRMPSRAMRSMCGV